MNQGRNRYTCRKCGGSIITEDRDQGTTPFMLACRATKDCSGMMESSFYRGDFVNDGKPADFIWRKPTPEEYGEASLGMRQHFDLGGLDIFPAQFSAEKGNP